jgi:hypothetical protein
MVVQNKRQQTGSKDELPQRSTWSVLDLFSVGPPWNLRFVPGIVIVIVLIIYVLSPHNRTAHLLERGISQGTPITISIARNCTNSDQGLWGSFV